MLESLKKEERVDGEVEVSPCKRIGIDRSLVKDAFRLQELGMTAAGIPQLERSGTQYLTSGASDTDGTIEEETRIDFALGEALDIARLAGAIEKVLPVLRKFVPLLKKVRSEDDDDKENQYRMCACGCGEGISREEFEGSGCGYCGDRDCENECQEQYCSNCGKKDCGAVMDEGLPGDESCILSC
jgi:hypothetical protein